MTRGAGNIGCNPVYQETWAYREQKLQPCGGKDNPAEEGERRVLTNEEEQIMMGGLAHLG